MSRAFLLLAVAALTLGACAVVTPERAVRNLEFEFVAEGSGLRRLDLPGIGGGSPSATVRIRTRVSNPNPLALRLTGLEFDLYVNANRAASGSFAGGVDLPARGQTVLDLDVTVGLAEATRLVSDLAAAARGQRTAYRLDGTVSVDAGPLGRPSFGPLTIVTGTVSAPLSVVFPTFRVDLERSGITELRLPNPLTGDAGIVRVRLRVLVENPGPLGYNLTGTSLNLAIAGIDVARAGLPAGAGIRSNSVSAIELAFDFPLQNLGLGVVGLFQAVQRGEPVQAVVRGSVSLNSGAVGAFPLPVQEIVEALIRTR